MIQNINNVHKNGIIKKLNNEDIEYLYKYKLCFPCLLNVNDNGELESNLNCLKKIPKKNINFKIENQREEEMIKSDINNSLKNEAVFSKSFIIPKIFSEFLFKTELNNISEEQIKKTYQITKYKLLSININKEHLSFSEDIINEFKEISKSYESDEVKAEKIENVFRETGFKIPLKIYLGGIYSIKDKESYYGKKQNEKNSFEVKFLQQKIIKKERENKENKYKSENYNTYNNVNIIGGDVLNYNKEDWIKTINLENSNVIEYSNIIDTQSILSLELRNKLSKPLKMVAEKYKMRDFYLKNITSLKEERIKLLNYSDNKNFEKGNIQECKPHIYLKKEKVRIDISYFKMWNTFFYERNFKDIIVGLKIIGNRDDNEYNGEWTILNNPILSKEIKIKFESQFYRVINYFIEIYLMKTPE